MSKRTLGVVIARFQAPSLTPAHQYLLEQVATRSSRVLVLLGVAKIPLTKRNPLEYSIRARMVYDWWAEQFPDGPEVIVVPLHDRPTDVEWAGQVDQIISAIAIGSAATVYCGPDGAGPHYAQHGGTHPVEVLDCAGGHAARIRAELLPRHTEDFRAGVIYATERRMLGPFMTVDAIIRKVGGFPEVAPEDLFLLARKREDGGLWRFVGGFVDLQDTSLEHACRREVREETGLEVSTPAYIGSVPINDWRYRSGPETIMTALFAADWVFGAERAADDIDLCSWHRFGTITEKLHPVHQPLWDLYNARRT